MVGGGVRGKGAGTVLRTIDPVGFTIEAFHLFIHGYPQVGGLITGSIVGEGTNGTTNEYLISTCSRTGEAGRRADIGKSKILGVLKG
jgi:hypothetical protein